MIAKFCEKHPHTVLQFPTRGGFPACYQCGRIAIANLNAIFAELRSRQRYKRVRDIVLINAHDRYARPIVKRVVRNAIRRPHFRPGYA